MQHSSCTITILAAHWAAISSIRACVMYTCKGMNIHLCMPLCVCQLKFAVLVSLPFLQLYRKLSMYSYMFLSMYHSVHLFICLPISTCVYLSIYVSIYLPTYLRIYLFLNLPIYRSLYRSIYLSISTHNYQYLSLPYYVSIYLFEWFLYLSMYIYICIHLNIKNLAVL